MRTKLCVLIYALVIALPTLGHSNVIKRVAILGIVDKEDIVSNDVKAKILNVETAQLDKTSNIQTATDIESMDEACRELAAHLLDVQRGRIIIL